MNIMNFLCCKKNKRILSYQKPDIPHPFSSEKTDIINYKWAINYDNKYLYDITKKIRNGEKLNEQDYQFISKLSGEEIINIIKLYDECLNAVYLNFLNIT